MWKGCRASTVIPMFALTKSTNKDRFRKTEVFVAYRSQRPLLSPCSPFSILYFSGLVLFPPTVKSGEYVIRLFGVSHTPTLSSETLQITAGSWRARPTASGSN